MLVPRQKTPNLSVPTLDQGLFDLSSETSQRGTVLCFYRGLHCPLCATYLKEFQALVTAFAERGVGTIAISSDGQERAEKMAQKIGIDGCALAMICLCRSPVTGGFISRHHAVKPRSV